MIHIFQFIFNCLKDIFNLLSFTLPGINLTFIDFFLLSLIIPLMFKLVKGAVVHSGEDTMFGLFNELGGISSTASLSYQNYKNKKLSKPELVYSDKHSIKTNINNYIKY